MSEPGSRADVFHRKWRQLAKALFTILALIGAVVVTGLPLYVFPASTSAPDHVDAVVVLGPAYGSRVQQAQAMVETGQAGQLVISRDPATVASGSQRSACERSDVICFLPEPATTRGEVAFVNELAAERSWSSVAVVTGTTHVTRARFIFDTCATIAATVIEVPERDRSLISWARQYL